MRLPFGSVFASLAILTLSAAAASASDVEVKGPHICCGNCVDAVGKLLGKVDGITDVKASTKNKTVTFKATDDAVAKAGVKALVDGGFFGTATADGKEMKIDAAGTKAEKADKITVKGVHACCGMCTSAIKGLFKDSKVTIEGKDAQRTVIIEGAGLEPSAVLESLRKKGFNGKIEK
jgi:periplasmic mercuric ion binding protein